MKNYIFPFIAVSLLAMTAVFSDENPSGNKYAIIIAVSQYDNEQFSLPLTANDAAALANTLHQRGGFEVIPLYESLEKGVTPAPQTIPTKENIVTECQRVLENCKPGDTVLLYFSGHGFPHPQDAHKTYLLPKDVDVKRIPDTFLETAWLRDQLSRCQAATKFFMIDACHAGGEKSINLDPDSDLQKSKSLSSHELIDGDMEGVITLASSTKNQLSYFWEEKEMSLFSYWLNEGLKGHADLNGDGEITFNELDEYVVKSVSKTAREIKNVTQTPVRIVRSDVSGVPVVMTPRAVSLDVLLDDLAEQIAAAMRVHNVKRTGVLEFSMEQGGRALDRTNYGTLAAYCAEQLEERIKYRLPRRDGFRIVAREAVEKALTTKGIGPDGLFDRTISEANITFNDRPLESYVVGTIESRQSGEIGLRCVLVSVDNIEKLHTSRGTALLTESEWGMLGRSAAIPEEAPANVVNAEPVIVVSENVTVVDPADFLPPPKNPRSDYKPPRTVSVKPVNRERVTWIDHTVAQMPNPLLVPNRFFDAGIEVRQPNGTFANRPLQAKQNEMFVPLQQGDVYRIRVRNGYQDYVAARILVDGLNTLPQKREAERTKFMAIAELGEKLEDDPPPEEGDDEPEEVLPEMAPRVNLETARYWLLPPGKTCQVQGFFEKVGSNAVGREFRVTEAPKSLAAQKEFTEQIGIVTIAYYSTKPAEPGTRGLRRKESLGTEAGEAFQTSVRVRDDLEIDELLGIIQIRYAENDFVGEPAEPTRQRPAAINRRR